MTETESRSDFLLTYLWPIGEYLADPAVTEIMINPKGRGEYAVFIERDAVMLPVDAKVSENSLWALAQDIARKQLHREINEYNPSLSASLEDGSRIAILIPPNVAGVMVTIRKFRPSRFTLPELISGGAITEATASTLHAAILAHRNILIAGANGSGKTTMLNSLAAACIPSHRRIICIEDDAREIHLDSHSNCNYLQSSAHMSIAKLVDAALRHRIQHIMIGEIIGAEGMALLNGLATGHSGSFATIHAESPTLALDRLAACAMESGTTLTYQAIRLRIASSIHYVLHMENRKVVALGGVKSYDSASDQFAIDILPGSVEVSPKN